MKKILILFLFLFFIPIIKAEEVEDLAPNATSAIMIEASTGEILFQKNKDEKLAPASMTKMMSMLIIIEEIENGNLKWDEMITTSERASSMGGSQIFLKAGEKMSVTDLLKGIAIASGNDAVVALAERISGSEESFVKRMNTRAKDLGLKNTNFVNSTGLTEDNHYSSAYDMSLIAKELVKHEKILEFTSTYEDYLRKDTKSPFWLVNTNRLVRFKEGVDGLKTGFTKEAGYCLTATMKKDNMRLITVVMKEEDTNKRSADTSKMLDYGFNVYMVQTILDEKTTIEKQKVELGKKLTTEIVPKESITILNKKNEEIKNITYKTNINKIIAPVKKGDKVGTIDIIEEGKVISTIDATVKENIEKAASSCMAFTQYAEQNGVEGSHSGAMPEMLAHRIPDDLKELLIDKKLGELTGPVDMGPYVVFVMKCGVRTASVLPDDETIKQQLFMQEMEKNADKILKKQREKILVKKK